MNASFIRRAGSYIIDIVILSLVITLSLTLFSKSNKINIEALNNELTEINEQRLEGVITTKNYIYRYADINYELDKYEMLPNILNCIFIIVLFIYIPFFMKGQTIGMKIFHIKMVKNNDKELKINDYFLRSLLIYFLGYLLITLISITFVSSFTYLMYSIILIFLQFLLVLSSIFMILYRHDKKALQDILTNTKVVNV